MPAADRGDPFIHCMRNRKAALIERLKSGASQLGRQLLPELLTDYRSFHRNTMSNPLCLGQFC
jgi:hypothetical protein